MPRATALTDQRAVSSALKGIGFMVAGMAFLVMSDAVSKYLVQSHPVGQVMCLRQGACLLFVLALVWRGAGLKVLRAHNVSLQIARGLVFICSGYLIVWSLSLLPLPTVTAITFSGPIMIALMSAPLLGERVGPSLWAATLVGFVGMLFIIQPGGAAFSWALLIPVVAALASSVRDILTRILARTDGSMAILFWSSLVLVFGTALTAPFGWREVSVASWGLFFLGGFVNFCAHFLIIESLRLARAAVVAPLKYTSLIWSAVLGYAIWADLPNASVWLGAAILVASGLWIAHTQRH